MRLLLRTSIRTCKRCGTASRSIGLFEVHTTDVPKIERLVAYNYAYLPADVELKDIERRTDVGPLAVCPACIDALPAPRAKLKPVTVDLINGEETEIKPNRFVLVPRPKAVEPKKLPPRPTKLMSDKDFNNFLNSL